MIAATISIWMRCAAALATPFCAMSLAFACGERTFQAPAPAVGTAAKPGTPGTARHVGARLELPVASDAKPTGVVALDLNGDGRDEIVAVTRAPGTLQIWSGVSNQLGAPPAPLVLAIDDFALGPVWVGGTKPASKDAPARIAFASRAKPGVSVVDLRAIRRAQAGTALQLAWHVDLERRPRVLASGDLDHDGKPELAVITIDDDLLLVRGPNDVTKMRLGDEQATCALFGADGKSIYVGFQGSRRLVRYEIEGAKLVEKNAVTLEGLPRALDQFDFGKPFDPHAVFVAGGDDRVWIFDPGLRFVESREVGAIPIALEHGDFGGVHTLATLALQGQTVALDFDSGSGRTARQRVQAGQHPLACAFGDFDGDAKVDLAIANGDAKRVSVLFGDGHGGFEIAPSAKSARAPHSLAIGDLDGDKQPDVVALSALEGNISVFANHSGTLADHDVQGDAQSADAVRLADLDGDGFLDAAYLRRTDKGSVLEVCFGDGHGHLWQRPEVAPVDVGKSSGDLLFADLEKDGKLAAIVADPEGGKVALVQLERVKGPGLAFGKASAVDVQSSPRALALLDAHGDAKPEIAVALGSPGKRFGVAILRTSRDASGQIVLEERALIPLDEGALAIAAADFDGNGFPDLAVLVAKSEADSAYRVLYQSPDRTWSVSGRTPVSLRPYALRAGDLDGDGRPDIVVSAQNSHHLNLWLNGGGSPVSWIRTADICAGTGPLDVQLADLDGDGRLEIVVANSFSNEVSVIRFR